MDPFAVHKQQQDNHKCCNDKYYNANGGNSSEPVFDIKSPEFSSDHFRMYDFKVKACPRTRAHDWTQCPFAHPGEKARRRDPRKFNYSAVPCPDYRKGTCKRGDSCEYAHGVFECWLHPTRYRTQMCTDGTACNRLVCFFAHHQGELRLPTDTGGMGMGMASSQQVLQPQQANQQQIQSNNSVQQQQGGNKDQLYSVALAHLLAYQNQNQNHHHHHHQHFLPGSPSQGGFPQSPNHQHQQQSQQNAQMNALLQQVQEIQKQILTSQQMVMEHGQGLGGQIPINANGMHPMQGMQGAPPLAYPPPPHMVQQQQQQQQRNSYDGSMSLNMSPSQHVRVQSTPQKVEGSVPYYPLSPSSPIDMYFPQEESPVVSPIASSEASEISRMASSLKDLSFQAYNLQSQQQSQQGSGNNMAENALMTNDNRRLSNHHPDAYHHHQQQQQHLESNRAINQVKNVGKCGSMENLLSALPRSLSDVGLADKGISLVSQV